MTPNERRALAEQLKGNPLLWDIIEGLERNAIERCISASDHETRERAAMMAQTVRSFRRDCESALSTPKRKAAPA